MSETTPMYDWHITHGGRMVDFAGFLLPVQYETGIIKEHNAVREATGVFDVTHMGEFNLKGSGALSSLQTIVTNDCSKMKDGQVKYSPVCNEKGGTVDDILVYRKNENEYMLVVNASNKDKDFAHMKALLKADATLLDLSGETALIALQGPNSGQLLGTLGNAGHFPVKYYSFRENVEIAGVSCLVSKTGYTGEDGFELYVEPAKALMLWEAIVEAGQTYGLLPCGLGARDTLRLEASMPLYGHEMDEEISPIEAGLGVFVKMDKGDFVGRAALEKKTPVYRRTGLKILDKGIARDGADVLLNGKKAGVVTSGAHSVTLGYPVAMARVETALLEQMKPGDEAAVLVRGRTLKAEFVEMPFYKKTK